MMKQTFVCAFALIAFIAIPAWIIQPPSVVDPIPITANQ